MLDPSDDQKTTERVIALHNALANALDQAEYVGDAISAIGMLANLTFRQVEPAHRLDLANGWAQTFLANVRASLGQYDA